jgi:hypothetical protein
MMVRLTMMMPLDAASHVEHTNATRRRCHVPPAAIVETAEPDLCAAPCGEVNALLPPSIVIELPASGPGAALEVDVCLLVRSIMFLQSTLPSKRLFSFPC